MIPLISSVSTPSGCAARSDQLDLRDLNPVSLAGSPFEAKSARGLLALMRCRGVGGQRALRLALRWDVTSLRAHLSQTSHYDHDLKLLNVRCTRELNALDALGLDSALTRRVTSRECSQWRELISSDELARGGEWAQRELDRQHAMNARVIGFFDHDYPEFLRLIPRPPPLIFVQGNVSPLNRSLHIEESSETHESPHLTYELTIVGTRRPGTRGARPHERSSRRSTLPQTSLPGYDHARRGIAGAV